VPDALIEKPELLDHRFFFQREDGTGRYTCGIVRKAVADELFRNEQYFADANFLKLLPRFIDNPPTTGFFMEDAVLFYLRLNGIPHHQYLGNHMEVINFDTSIPQIKKDIKGKPVIYHPTKFNYKTLDEIIVFIKKADDQRAAAKKGGKKMTKRGKEEAMESDMESDLEDHPEQREQEQKEQLLLYPYQVTLRREPHKDSHALFFKEYNRWVEDLKEFDVETEFIWFTGDPSSYTDHPQSEPQPKGRSHRSHRSGYVCDPSKWPAHRERVISFDCLSKELGQRYEEAQKGKGKLICMS
jgi:hypothetical protein